jgi:hypothetical protein
MVWNFVHSPHVEKIAVDADRQRTFPTKVRTEYRHICGIAAQVRRQFGGQYHDARASGSAPMPAR